MQETTRIQDLPGLQTTEPAGLPSGIMSSLEATIERGACGMVPQNFEQANALGKMYHRAGLVKGRGSKEISVDHAVAIILAGMELGLTPFQALQHLYVVYGGVGMSRDLAKSLLLRKGYRFRWVMDPRNNREWIGKNAAQLVEAGAYAEIEVREPGSPDGARYLFDMASAQALDLLRPPAPGKKQSNWLAQPTNMLAAACVRRACRDMAPNLLMGVDVEPEAFQTPELEPQPEKKPADALADTIREMVKPRQVEEPSEPTPTSEPGTIAKVTEKKAKEVAQANALLAAMKDAALEVPRYENGADPDKWTNAQRFGRIRELKAALTEHAEKLAEDVRELTGEEISPTAKTVADLRQVIKALTEKKRAAASGDKGSPI